VTQLEESVSAAASRPPAPAPRTIGRLWADAFLSGRAFPAYLVERDGGWEEVSWADAGRRIEELAWGLLSLGVRKGEAVAIVATTRLEWAFLDFAIGLVGGVGAPIYPSSSAADCAYVVDHSEANVVFVEDEEQRDKIEGGRANLPHVRHVISFAELDELIVRGREHAAAHPDALAEAAAAVSEDDLFTYIYTSGTTGPPKACMIRHRNYYAMADMAARVEGFTVAKDVMLLYLPLAHNFGRLMHLLGPYKGFTVAFCPDPYAVGDALPAVRPTVFPSVPRIYEKIHTAVVARMGKATGIRRALAGWALRVGRRASLLRRDGKALPPLLAAQHRLADRLVYGKVKQRLGGRFRVGISGGAPLAPEIAEFFHALDILILEGYGLTECTTAATVNRPSRFRFGTVGLALPDVELKVDADGELLIRSPTIFAGYYKDEDATREVLGEDGWLRSGDIAEIDADGFVRITDRKKDIIITAGGKNVAPQNLENELKSSPYISQALVVGDRRPYVVALLTLDPDEIERWRAAGGEDAEALVGEVVDRVNQNRSRFEQIKRFTILPRDFSAQEGEVTPTMKLRRGICAEHFAAEIEALYPSSERSEGTSQPL
jgi:long-chain acyl-CoA synthetase